jgi:hypothetical protein
MSQQLESKRWLHGGQTVGNKEEVALGEQLERELWEEVGGHGITPRSDL